MVAMMMLVILPPFVRIILILFIYYKLYAD